MCIPRTFLRDKRGVSAVEYALLLGAILLVVVLGFRVLGQHVKTQTECASQFGGPCAGDQGSARGPIAGALGAFGDWVGREASAAGKWLGGIGSWLGGAGAPPTFANQVYGKRPERIDQDLSKMAGDVNGVHDGNEIGGFRRLKPEEIPPGITMPLDDPKTGFRAALYVDGQGRAVAAFAGTAFGDMTNAKDIHLGPLGSVKLPIDLENDILQGEGQMAPQYQQAVEFVREAKAVYGENLACTGQSLGGGLCSAASLVNDVPGVTFNAAGLHDETMRRFGLDPDTARQRAAAGLDRAYHVKGEILTTIQENSELPKAPGAKIELNDPNPIETCFMCFERDIGHMAQLHSSASVDAALAKDRPWDR